MTHKEKGYQISYDAKQRILYQTLWGLWDKHLAEQFRQDFVHEVKMFGNDPQGWHILSNLRHYPAQTREIQEIFTDAMNFAKIRGVQKVARVVDKIITQLQFKRLSQEVNFDSAFFQSEEEARAWLLEQKTEENYTSYAKSTDTRTATARATSTD